MTMKRSESLVRARPSGKSGMRMSKASDAAQLRRLQRLAEMQDDQIDTSDLPVVENWSDGVRGGTPREVRLKAAAAENGSGDGAVKRQAPVRRNPTKLRTG
jgi:hypothetical protein